MAASCMDKSILRLMYMIWGRRREDFMILWSLVGSHIV